MNCNPDLLEWNIPGWRLRQLEEDAAELKAAKALIARLRAENTALKEDRQEMTARAVAVKARFLETKSYPHAYGAIICARRMGLI